MLWKFVDGLDDIERVIGDDCEQHDSGPSFEPSPQSVLGTTDAADHSRMAQGVPGGITSFPNQPQSRFQEQYYHGESGMIEHQDMGESNNDDERRHENLVAYPSVLVHSPTDAEESVRPIDGADFNRPVLEQPPSRFSRPAVSPSPGPSTGTNYNRNWLPSLSTMSETFSPGVQREEPSDQQPLANHKRSGLLKFYVDEVAPWVSISREV